MVNFEPNVNACESGGTRGQAPGQATLNGIPNLTKRSLYGIVAPAIIIKAVSIIWCIFKIIKGLKYGRNRERKFHCETIRLVRLTQKSSDPSTSCPLHT